MDQQELKNRFCAELQRVVSTRAFGARVALTDIALVELVGIAAANLLDQFIVLSADAPVVSWPPMGLTTKLDLLGKLVALIRSDVERERALSREAM